MYRLAICDDEHVTCNELEEMITEYAKKYDVHMEIDMFHDLQVFCRYLKRNNNYDLIFLDIEFEEMNGIDAGKYIREELRDEKTLITYISSKERYALQLFEIGTFEFLVKPVDVARVQKVLDRALKKLSTGKQFFEYSVGKNCCRIKVDEILFFQSHLRKIQIVTVGNEQIEFYGKLREIYKALPNGMFAQIHNSYIINLNYVKEYTYESIKMSSNQMIGISKKYRKSLRDKIFEERNCASA